MADILPSIIYIGNWKFKRAYFFIDKFSNLMLLDIPSENFVILFYEKSLRYSNRVV